MKYYKVDFYFKEIEEVEVQRETDGFIWIDGVKKKKETQYDSYFKTLEEAKQSLKHNLYCKMVCLREDIKAKEMQIEKIEKFLKEIEK